MAVSVHVCSMYGYICLRLYQEYINRELTHYIYYCVTTLIFGRVHDLLQVRCNANCEIPHW